MEDQSLDIEITDGGFTEEEINEAAMRQREAQEVLEQYNKEKEQRELEAEEARKQGYFSYPFNDRAGLLHHEAQCRCRNDTGNLAGVFEASPLYSAFSGARLSGNDKRP